MKNKKTISGYFGAFWLLLLTLSATQIFAQPGDAQLKKQLTSPRTVTVTLGAPGKIEWSSTYKKYMWTRSFTARLKTDTPGEILVVRGYAAYDVMGGRYVYWRTFTSSNNYEGKKNPTVAEINQALEQMDLRRFASDPDSYIGEFESFRIAPDADWEWHTPDSVSFNVVAVYRVIFNGRHYDNEEEQAPYQYRQGFKAIDKVESLLRLRLYRKGANLPWSNVGVSSTIRNPQNRGYLMEVKKLLERNILPDSQVERMPRMSKVPLLRQ